MSRISKEDVINVAYSINANIDESTAEYIAENYDRNRLDYPFDNWHEAIEQMIYQTKEQ